MIIFIFYLILIVFIFCFINNYLLKNKYEYFDKLSDGLVCGTKGDVCSVDDYNTNSCCKGYNCIRPEGNYYNKICVNNDSNSNNLFDGIINMQDNSELNKTSSKSIENDISSAFNKGLSDVEGAFSKIGSYFSGFKIDLGDACNK